MTLEQALVVFDASMEAIGGCGDGYCMVTGKTKGQHTNGGCRCASNKMTAQRVMGAARRLRDELSKLST